MEDLFPAYQMYNQKGPDFLNQIIYCFLFVYFWIESLFLFFQQQAAATVVFCACAEELDGIGGHYFNNCLAVEPCDQAKDPDAATELWELSERLIKREDHFSDLVGHIY